MNAQRVRGLFLAGVLLKGLHAVFELAGGLLLLAIGTPALRAFVDALTLGELTEDPHDFIATHLRQMAEGLTGSTQHFYALLLVAHGIVKIGLVAGLLADKRWAFPAALWVLGAFVVYQLCRYTHTQSLMLLVLSAFDVAVMVLIWREWRNERAGRGDPV